MHAQHDGHVHPAVNPRVMKLTTATALRANIVLLSVSTGIAIIPCLSLDLLFGLPDSGTPTLPFQGGTFAVALLIMLLLRWWARRAFDAAVAARKVEMGEKPGVKALIADDCRRAWLVQLHLELHGRQCGD
ncbi:hypothetical protein LMG27177_06916 [Paraburkholderia fynbosensis]|uniref:Uncharacterized protein n=2 Tax=Paraburkholderia fynbosensis TaxID=1200993 RepID=A0A6J5H339_9BURK|nr:hypothetical protein LMG27177_06916 [Paraburkholderia fynbosensis]